MHDYLKRSGAMDDNHKNNNVVQVVSSFSCNKRRKLDSSKATVDLLNTKADGSETDGYSIKESSNKAAQSKEETMMKSSSYLKTTNRNYKKKSSTASAAPPAEEIEEFFSIADKYHQIQFVQKYNYDIVKDVPLEGRYQWVKLNH